MSIGRHVYRRFDDEDAKCASYVAGEMLDE